MRRKRNIIMVGSLNAGAFNKQSAKNKGMRGMRCIKDG